MLLHISLQRKTANGLLLELKGWYLGSERQIRILQRALSVGRDVEGSREIQVPLLNRAQFRKLEVRDLQHHIVTLLLWVIDELAGRGTG